MLEILFEDEDFVAINKPHGLLVHKSSIAADTSEFALQLLRDQIGKKVYPAHRLDRKTAGVLLFSLNKEMDSAIQTAFSQNLIKKEYLAVLRGHTGAESVHVQTLTLTRLIGTLHSTPDLLAFTCWEERQIYGKIPLYRSLPSV